MKILVKPAARIFGSYGFEESSQTQMFYKLLNLSPDGGTALRNSIKAGIGLVVNLCEELKDSDLQDEYNIIHIVITDGSDEHSNLSAVELGRILYGFNQKFGSSHCKTVLVGISLDQLAATELSFLSQAGGDSCKAFNVENVDFSEILKRMSINIGVRQEIKLGLVGEDLYMINKNIPYIEVRRKKLAILFNLDFSSSMRGPRWVSLMRSAAEFASKLSPGDLVTCIFFNHQVKMLNEVIEDYQSVDIYKNLIKGISFLDENFQSSDFCEEHKIQRKDSNKFESRYEQNDSSKRLGFYNYPKVVELSDSEKSFRYYSPNHDRPTEALARVHRRRCASPNKNSYEASPNKNNYRASPNKNSYKPNPDLNNYKPAPNKNSYKPNPDLNNYKPAPNKNSYKPNPDLNNYKPALDQNRYGATPNQNNYKPAPNQNRYEVALYENNYQPVPNQNRYEVALYQNIYKPVPNQNIYEAAPNQNSSRGPTSSKIKVQEESNPKNKYSQCSDLRSQKNNSSTPDPSSFKPKKSPSIEKRPPGQSNYRLDKNDSASNLKNNPRNNNSPPSKQSNLKPEDNHKAHTRNNSLQSNNSPPPPKQSNLKPGNNDDTCTLNDGPQIKIVKKKTSEWYCCKCCSIM